jgi:hypothetical protein
VIWREVRRWSVVAALGVVVLAVTAAPAAGASPGAPLASALRAQSPPDVDAIRAELAVDGVAVGTIPMDREALVRVVADAREAGLQLSLVILDVDPPTGDPLDLALLARDLRLGADTVLILSPSWIVADSGELGDRHVNQAIDAMESPDVVFAVEEFVEVALRPSRSWLLLVLGGVVLAVAAFVAGRWWEWRRRRKTDAARLDLIFPLRDEMINLGSSVVYLKSLVALSDPETQRRYAEASAAYREFREELEPLMRYPVEADRIDARLAAIRASLDQVRVAMQARGRAPG